MAALRFRVKWASVVFFINDVRQFNVIFVSRSEGAVRGTVCGVYHRNASCIVTVKEDDDILGEMLTFETK